MSDYEQSAGRGLEIVVGAVTLLIALLFLVLFLMLAFNAGFKYVTFVGGAILLLCTYWFGLISFRLLLNIPNKNGGLFSVGGLKFWCVFLGVSTLIVLPFALYMGHWVAVVSCVFMIYGCYKGWHMQGGRVRA
jgi:hypothetical protein